MVHSIKHLHERRLSASPEAIWAALDELWGATTRDAFPHDRIRPWRQIADQSKGLVLGTRFGHGPFSFTVCVRDERRLIARIDTPGFAGVHGFELTPHADHILLKHQLHAQLLLPQWLIWQAMTAPIHDWAVQALLGRLEHLLAHGSVPVRTPLAPPRSLAWYSAARRATRRLARRRHA